MEETKQVKRRSKAIKPIPRIYGRIVNGKLIEVEVKNCQACPVNHCVYCNFEGNKMTFISRHVSEMSKNGFPEFCTLKPDI